MRLEIIPLKNRTNMPIIITTIQYTMDLVNDIRQPTKLKNLVFKYLPVFLLNISVNLKLL